MSQSPAGDTDKRPRSGAEALQGWLDRVETGLLSLLFAAMVVVGLIQILLRNFAGTSLPWADGLLRALVLWTAMLGAVMAAGRLRHIRIDLIDHILPPGWLRVADTLALSISAAVCFFLCWHSLTVVELEFQFAVDAFLGVPGWVVQFIVPAAFVLIGARFLGHAIARAAGGERPR